MRRRRHDVLPIVGVGWSTALALAAACAPDAVFVPASTGGAGGNGATSGGGGSGTTTTSSTGGGGGNGTTSGGGGSGTTTTSSTGGGGGSGTTSGGGGSGGTGSTSTSTSGSDGGSGGAGGGSGGSDGGAPSPIDWTSVLRPSGGGNVATTLRGVATQTGLVGVVGTTNAEVTVANANAGITVAPVVAGTDTAFFAVIEASGHGKYAGAARVASDAPSHGVAIAPYGFAGFAVVHSATQASTLTLGDPGDGGAADVVTQLSSNAVVSTLLTASSKDPFAIAKVASVPGDGIDVAGTYEKSGPSLTWLDTDAGAAPFPPSTAGVFLATRPSGGVAQYRALIGSGPSVTVEDVARRGALHTLVGSFAGKVTFGGVAPLDTFGGPSVGYALVARENGASALVAWPPDAGSSAVGHAAAMRAPHAVSGGCPEHWGYVAGDGYISFVCVENQVPVVKPGIAVPGLVFEGLAIDPDSGDVAVVGEMPAVGPGSATLAGKTLDRGAGTASSVFVVVLDETLAVARLAYVLNPKGASKAETPAGVAVLPNQDAAKRRVVVAGHSEGAFDLVPGSNASTKAAWVAALRAW